MSEHTELVKAASLTIGERLEEELDSVLARQVEAQAGLDDAEAVADRYRTDVANLKRAAERLRISQFAIEGKLDTMRYEVAIDHAERANEDAMRELRRGR